MMNEKLLEQLINKYEIQGYDLHGDWDSQEIDKIKAFAEDYHLAMCAESEPATKPHIVADDGVFIWKEGYPPKDGKLYSAFFKTGDPMHPLRGQYHTVIFWSGIDWYDRLHGNILTDKPDYWMPLTGHFKALEKIGE